jgi:hypothetical protein
MGSPGGRWDVKLSPQIEWRVLCLMAAGPERMSLERCDAPRRHDLVAAQHRDRSTFVARRPGMYAARMAIPASAAAVATNVAPSFGVTPNKSFVIRRVSTNAPAVSMAIPIAASDAPRGLGKPQRLDVYTVEGVLDSPITRLARNSPSTGLGSDRCTSRTQATRRFPGMASALARPRTSR